MNLQQALDIVSTPLRVRGYSDNALVANVAKHASHGGPHLSTVPALHGDRSIRPADVLLRLASATRPRYQAELYDVHAHWGLLRYLGLFADGGGGRLVLSAAGRRIVSNQRRVTSEELGIGFAVLLAEEWIVDWRHDGSTVRTVDVDVALASGAIAAAEVRLLVHKTGVHRPDYLVVAESVSRPGAFSVALLECKGTKSRPNAYVQLGRAGAQLDSIMVGGRAPRGLAVSTVAANESITFHVLQHQPDASARMERGEVATQVRSSTPDATDGDLEVDLSQVFLEDLPQVDLSDGGPVDPRHMIATALRGSWAALAELAGNDRALRRWAPTVMRARINRTDIDRPRRERVDVDGVSIVGVSNAISLPGGQLKVVLGVEGEVDEALAYGTSIDVMNAQQRIFRRELKYLHRERRSASVVSIADDGSALALMPQ
ncbi:hypothetical protein [Dactylosporangium sp. NPDC000521]|uniref:hypothetical protein n=1 Tax=Dactylosporangium sp. NPDC000521 TaxID=3363975 RepID=UPI0036976632